MTEPLIDRPVTDGYRTGDGRRASLRRPLTGRYVGGVAAGIARWFGLDPLLVRVAFVVLSLFGGSGFLLYGLAWAIVPEDGAVDGPLRVWLNSRQRPFGLLRLAAYIALCFVSVWVLAFAYQVLVNGSRFGINLPLVGVRWLLGHGLQVGFLVAITLVALSVLSNDRDAPDTAESVAYAPPPPPPAAGLPLGPPAGDAALVENLRRRRLFIPRSRHRRSPLGWLMLGLALAVTAVLAGFKSADHLSGVRIGAIALLILAVGLLIGAFAGWSRWLVVIAAVLTLGLIPPTLTRAATDKTYTDTVTVDSQFVQRGFWSINRSTGTEIVDLSAVSPPRIPQHQQPVDSNGNAIEGAKPVTSYDQNGWIGVTVDAGKAIVTLPRAGKWQVSAHTSFGTISMPDGVASRGFNAQSYLSSDGADGCCLQAVTISGAEISIDINVSYGDIEVRRAAS